MGAATLPLGGAAVGSLHAYAMPLEIVPRIKDAIVSAIVRGCIPTLYMMNSRGFFGVRIRSGYCYFSSNTGAMLTMACCCTVEGSAPSSPVQLSV
jgi:hypothetical protein